MAQISAPLPGIASLRVGIAVSVDNDVEDGWLLYDRVTLTALSQPVPVAPGQSLDLSAAVRGELAGPAGQVSGRLAAHFYDSQGNLLGISPIWQAAAYNRPTTPLTHSGSVSHPPATQVRVGLLTVLDEGWLAFASIKLSSLSAPIAVRPGQMHTLAARVSGQVNGANAGRLFIKYSNGTIVNVWQNTSTFNGSQSVSGSFTTPATVASFQVGTAVTLDKGYLDFSEVTLTAYSNALPITAGGTYQFTGQVAGVLAAPLGQGGRIVAVYTNVDGQSAGEDLLWQNPTNFNGTVPVQQTFTANAGAVTLRLALTAVLDAGHLGFSDFDLLRLTAGVVTRRSTYMLAGQAVAVRVTGDPDGNDGLHYLYSDHLGSASAMQKDDGSAPIVTRYLPFGGYRDGSGPNGVTDRGFTGHKHNDDLGLVYMNARFYVSGIGRFASADTIIPNPANPQSYNRYSYVLNRALNATDPTGHRECGAFDGCSGEALPIITQPTRKVFSNQDLAYITIGTLAETSGGKHSPEVIIMKTWAWFNRLSPGSVFAGIDSSAQNGCPAGTQTCGAWYGYIQPFLPDGITYPEATPSQREVALQQAYNCFNTPGCSRDEEGFQAILQAVNEAYQSYRNGGKDPTNGGSQFSHQGTTRRDKDGNITYEFPDGYALYNWLSTNLSDYQRQNPGFRYAISAPYRFPYPNGPVWKVFIVGNQNCISYGNCIPSE